MDTSKKLPEVLYPILVFGGFMLVGYLWKKWQKKRYQNNQDEEENTEDQEEQSS